MEPRVQFESQFISEPLSKVLVDLGDFLKQRGIKLSFESETLLNQGSMLTIEVNDEKLEVEVDSPEAFDLDAHLIQSVLGKVYLYS